MNSEHCGVGVSKPSPVAGCLVRRWPTHTVSLIALAFSLMYFVGDLNTRQLSCVGIAGA